MKKMILLFVLVAFVFCVAGCQKPATTPNTASTQSVANENSTAAQTQSTEDEAQSQEAETPTESEINPTEEEETMQISVKSADYEIIYELNNSNAAKTLYDQLPLTMDVEPFSNNEMTFYPPQKLDTSDTPLSSGEAGTLSYYSPWGDVVMFYDYCNPNGSLYGLGQVVSGKENIEKLSGTITISKYTGE